MCVCGGGEGKCGEGVVCVWGEVRMCVCVCVCVGGGGEGKCGEGMMCVWGGGTFVK